MREHPAAFLRYAQRAMPLYPRRHADHYPDATPSPYVDLVIVLCGHLEVGSYHRISGGPSQGNWHWGASITSETRFVATGYARTPDECKAHIAKTFREMLARADLRERADAKPGPPRRDAQSE